MEQHISDESLVKEVFERLDPPFIITVTSYRRLKHDPDGVSIKALLDGIVRAGLLKDDSWEEIKEIRLKSIKAEEEKTIIEITEADEG